MSFYLSKPQGTLPNWCKQLCSQQAQHSLFSWRSMSHWGSSMSCPCHATTLCWERPALRAPGTEPSSSCLRELSGDCKEMEGDEHAHRAHAKHAVLSPLLMENQVKEVFKYTFLRKYYYLLFFFFFFRRLTCSPGKTSLMGILDR